MEPIGGLVPAVSGRGANAGGVATGKREDVQSSSSWPFQEPEERVEQGA